MIIKILIEYEDPNDVARPPRICKREWKEINVTPNEWYNILANVKGTVFFKI